MEIWREIKEYEDSYQVSNLGNVKSLNYNRTNKEKLLKLNINTHGYLTVGLYNGGNVKTFRVHQLVAVAFLNHTINGYKVVVDHINNDKLNNTLGNLQLISQRENVSKDKKGFSSQYIGVYWSKNNKKWSSQIQINGKLKHLGLFNSELIASKAYNTALNCINNGKDIELIKEPRASKLTKTKVVRITEEQHKTLVKMKSFNIDVGSFIRNAIKEKIEREHKEMKPKTEKEKELDSFSKRLKNSILAVNK